MWAVTHSRPPVALRRDQVDNLYCLGDSWNNVPAPLRETRVPPPPPPQPSTPPPSVGVPPTTKRMQAATQINDAFARFFVVPNWTDRRGYAESLFAYPAAYADPKSVLMAGNTTLANPDQWLALHTSGTAIARKVGCYAYIPSTAAGQRSLMYAVAEPAPAGAGSSAQVLLIATFADSPSEVDAKIDRLEVSDSITADQRDQITRANPGGQCSSGWAPRLLTSPR